MILVLNCGSQSVKWKIFDRELNLLSQCNHPVLKGDLFSLVLQEELKKISAFKISLIGHRVVHGGGIFMKPTNMNELNLAELEKISHLAPLHNPFSILGIKACHKFFKRAVNIAFFDSEFFSDLPEKVYTYALPEKIVKELRFRRYGFHGISHEYVAKECAKKVKKPFEKLKIITCHLGGGSSIAAIKNGKAIDISMGFSPLEGLAMASRSGSLDPAIVLELVKKFSVEKTSDILNNESGIKGICGQSDMLKVLDMIKFRNSKAKLAFDVFVYSIQKCIGAYFAILGGCDILVFTGAIGAGDPATRKSVCRGLSILKKTKILSIKTDEETAIANKINLNYEKHSLV